ncbi:MAG: hypothetical protein ABS95_03235 [Verrucomicrobia bacterium SCN 57-15]|nr:MAG: hypothetical protein ABS95_03235 [Verrucomicrobia bacterium SCN 57-15]
MKELTELANGVVLDSPNLQPGVIALANEARFSSRHFSEPLTAYSLGWRDRENIEETLNFIAPPIQTPRKVEFKKADNAQVFYSETDDVRAIGSGFKRVEYTGTTAIVKTLNKGLTFRADHDEWDEVPNWQQNVVGMLKQRLLRNEFRRVLAAILAGATNTAKTWDTTAGKDPDQDVLTDLIAAVDSSGVRPNRVLYGDIAWNKRAVALRAQTNAGGFSNAGMTPDQVAGFLGVSGVKISRERYQSAAAAKSKVVPDVVLEFYAEDGAFLDDPSNSKRFWTPCRGGGMFAVYVQEHDKFTDITVEHYSIGVVPSTLGLRKLTIS